jgi:2,5-diketo-D-gluconate reductase A
MLSAWLLYAGLAAAQTITLNNGMEMPVASFGLQSYPGNNNENARYLMSLALANGFRNIFTSTDCGNQAGVALAMQQSNVTRSELFIIGSASTPGCNTPDDCANAALAQGAQNLRDLQVTQLDMILLDFAMGTCPQIQGQWKGLTAMLRANQTRSIGVSDFSPAQIDCILNSTDILGAPPVVPAVNQVQYSVFRGGDSSVSDNRARGVVTQGWSPLAKGAVLNDEDVKAIAAAHNRTAAQVGLRWVVQNNASFTTDPGSYEGYFYEDAHCCGQWALTPVEMALLDAKRASLAVAQA